MTEVCNIDQGRVSHAEKWKRANGGASDMIGTLAMRAERRRRQVTFRDPRLFMPEEGVKHLELTAD